MKPSSNTPPQSSPPRTPRSRTASQPQSPRSVSAQAAQHERASDTVCTDPAPQPIDQPLPNSDEQPIGLFLATPLPDAYLANMPPVRQAAPDKAGDIDDAALERLLAHWPQPQPVASDSASDSATPSQQTLALAVVRQPFLFEQLPEELQNLVLGALLGEPEQMHSAAQAAQMRSAYGQLLRVSQPVHRLTLNFRERVLRCTLRLAPMNPVQLQALPLHSLLAPGHVGVAPITVLQHLAQAMARLRTDEQACHAALALGRQLLQALLLPGITPATQRALLCVPQLTVWALRARLHGAQGYAHSITSTLRGLMHWAMPCGPDLATPLLCELLFTVAQVSAHAQEGLIESLEVSLYTGEVEDTLCAVCALQGPPASLILGIYRLVELMPNPWSAQAPALPAPQDISEALEFLAGYPHAFVGFAQEVLAYLRTLPLDDDQTDLLQHCLQRQAAPLAPPRERDRE